MTCFCFSGGLLKHFDVVLGIQKLTRSRWIENLINWKEEHTDQNSILLFVTCQQFETSLIWRTYLTPNTFRIDSFSAFYVETLKKTEGECIRFGSYQLNTKKCKDASFSQHPCFYYTKNSGAKLFLTKIFATGIIYLFVSYIFTTPLFNCAGLVYDTNKYTISVAKNLVKKSLAPGFFV
jgi:hypothetical protein